LARFWHCFSHFPWYHEIMKFCLKPLAKVGGFSIAQIYGVPASAGGWVTFAM
jgi:hypothetical protein